MGSRLRDTVQVLFELFCEVSPGDNVKEPYILRKYPETYGKDEELKNIPKFTFPCKIDNTYIQHYSFVLTSVDSKYTFCFCRYDPKVNTAVVLLSHLPWHDIFYKLLDSIAQLLNGPERDGLTSFLEACRAHPPMSGHTLKVIYNTGQSMFTYQTPDNRLPSIPEDSNLTEYFSAVDVKCMAGLWAALLQERRIAIVGSKISRLSACVQAANATLFPMSWQHIFIPILPKHLVDYLLAPMPFLIGVPRPVMEIVRMSEIGDVVILDIDKNELRSPFNDLESLPPDMVSNLIKALSNRNDLILGDAVSRAFLRALVCLIGGYRDAVRIEKGQLITFNPEAFVKTRKNMQPFLKKVLQSQIFQQFIDERLDLLNSGRGFSDEFEIECNNYAEELSTGSGQKIKRQYRDWAKSVKKEGGAFFKNVRDKANPAVKSAVKSVRQGGKNVKSAMKGLTNRIPKSGSRSSSRNTTDENRFSCGSASPDSSGSSGSLPVSDMPLGASPSLDVPPPKDPPPALPLDLLNEMEFLFSTNSDSSTDITLRNKPKPLAPPPRIPPRLLERPKLSVRYPIISTQKLVDLSDAPLLPPRATPGPSTTQFISNITKSDEKSTDFHTSTISFSEGKDKTKLKLSTSNQRKSVTNAPCNGNALKLPPPINNRQCKDGASSTFHVATPVARPSPIYEGRSKEPCASESDLINLDGLPSDIKEFDPLQNDSTDKFEQAKTSTDSALLHEYGLDFSQFQFSDFNSSSGGAQPGSSVPKGWTTFN
ncbi:PREDICTED: DENN domain-containing protein 1B isoform X1 [Papilio xuthus]|uniref:DENN domain-containing protein 1B isoform X1 n=1 Tax=Papilio xuthus TaxID=66420 RepID=A0AAJ6ZUN6_PAPXU|nr:PREDICTED: DENN domain-containing protein 1B isoform X1 [Papilio xuthus]